MNSHTRDSGERERYSRRRVVFSYVFFVSVVVFVERSRAFVEAFPYHVCLGFMVLGQVLSYVSYLMAKTLTSVQNGANPYKKFLPQNKKRRKKTQDTVYSAMSSIPSGGPPGRTHTQELWYSLRGIDARLESVLSTYKCLCDAYCARFSTPNFVVFVLVFWTQFFVRI